MWNKAYSKGTDFNFISSLEALPSNIGTLWDIEA